ncbi:MAG TPA: polyphosphate kinase 2 family protein [Vicinamibacteria bacterium]|nr:polyphosphate kinase 2 family protein [Vicinamibacteria bacterium]
MPGESFRIPQGEPFHLRDHDPAGTAGLTSKEEGRRALARSLERLRELQAQLYALDRWAALLVFQAMDAAGKDSVIDHVMSGLNPLGCQAYSFKAPSDEELDHDFLWRTTVRLPERGRIGVFNRSHYEEVLVVRVHPELLGRQKLPPDRITENIWEERYEDIVAFERHLARSGTIVLKFFLNVSREEQRRRFLARLQEPEKHWKFSARDVEERRHWDAYMSAYEAMIGATSTSEAPWSVVPADRTWVTRAVVADVVVGALERLGLRYPEIPALQRRELERGRALLEEEGAAPPAPDEPGRSSEG